jgi:hypothetical protein
MSYGINAPTGLQVFTGDGQQTKAAPYAMRIASGYAANIFQGSPVMATNSGKIAIHPGDESQPILGVAVGFQYLLPGDLNPAPKLYWPANTVTVGAADAICYVITDLDMLFSIQMSDGAASVSAIFNNATIVNAGAGNPVTGISTCSLETAVAGNADYPLKVYDIDPTIGNFAATVAGQQYNNVLVKFNNHVSRAGTAGI